MYEVTMQTKDSYLTQSVKNGSELAKLFVEFINKTREDVENETNLMTVNEFEVYTSINDIGCSVAEFFVGNELVAKLDILGEFISKFEFLSIIGEA